MTCFHPIKAFIVGETQEGKKVHKFVKKSEQLQDYLYFNGKVYTEYDLLPCQRCIGCQIERSKQWATRLMLELMYHEKACFITLTYNDDYANVNLKRPYITKDGEFGEALSLKKSDFQKFMKRLRRFYYPKEIRFFACGEYGDKTFRPHYHAVLFGVDFSDDRDVFSTADGYVTYTSPILDKLWTDPETKKSMGHHLIAQVNWNTCAYVARYVTKKKTAGRNIYYQTFNVDPEFNLMSRRPGIGSQYYRDNREKLYITQEIPMMTSNGVIKFRVPKYYDKLYEIDEPEDYERIKLQRKECAENAMLKALEQTDKNYFEYLKDQEYALNQRIKSLKRDKL